MELLNRLKKYEKKLKGIPWISIERDYVQSWILATISEHQLLSGSLVFKGGTAIKKIWHSFRYSEDLDFTEIIPSTNADLANNITECLKKTKKLLNNYGGFELELKPYPEKAPHPFNQAAFSIHVQMPWQRRPMSNIKVEISRDEKLLFEPNKMQIIHEYGEDLSKYKVLAYALEEIVCEKFRGILQNQEKLNQKGWTRSRVRDFYDLWKIVNEYKQNLDLNKIKKFFPMKCESKGIEFKSSDQFFEASYLEYIKKDWSKFLNNLTDSLPAFEEVIINLRRHANEIF